MRLTTVQEQYDNYVEHTYARYDLLVAEGIGATCHDPQGREYVDFSSGIGVNALGFCDPGWVAAVASQLGRVQHISNLYYTQPGAELARLLCENSGMQKVFFANSGAEANEGAIKAARKYSRDKYGPGRHRILTLQNSFHGRTLATLSATGQDGFHRHFDPFVEGFGYLPAGDTAALEAAMTPDVCAIFIELIQGEGGVVPLDEDYVTHLARLCAQRDILLVADEVQTGIGRTGAFFCYQSYGISPDIVTAAKGLGGGLPIGAVLFGAKTAGTLGPGDHGSTFGGNPVVCAGACEVVRRLTQTGLMEQVVLKGDILRQGLAKLPQVGQVTGKGLMLGVEVPGLDARKVAAACLEEGLIVLTAKAKVRFLPPLTITDEEINRGLAAFARALAGLRAE